MKNEKYVDVLRATQARELAWCAGFWVAGLIAVVLGVYASAEGWRTGWKIAQAKAEYRAKVETMQGILDARRPTTNVVKLVWGGRDK